MTETVALREVGMRDGLQLEDPVPLAAKLANPDRQVCLLLGDGAFGFGGMEFDTMVRHGLPVVGVMSMS